MLFGAVLTAGDGYVTVGSNAMVMEHAIVRGRAEHPATLGDNVVVGPHAQVNGGSIAAGCFLATGSSVFPGARLEPDVELGFNALVHVESLVPEGSVVPIGWIAVGNPAAILSPGEHAKVQALLYATTSDATHYGTAGRIPAAVRMARTSEHYAEHRNDVHVLETSS